MYPTKLGLKALLFYGLLVCAFYAAPYLNLFFLLLSFLTVLGLLSMYWTLMNLVGLSGEIQEPDPMPGNASGSLHATIECGRRTRHHIRVDLRIRNSARKRGFDTHTAARAARSVGSAEIEGRFPPLPRGVHDVAGGYVTSTYPLGLLRVRTAIRVPRQLVVYPEPADLSHFRDRHEMLAELGDQGGHAAVEMGPAGLREFKPGDEIRHVHWKATARRQDLVVKEYEGDTQPGLEVLLDLRCSDEQLEEALSLVTALALSSHENKDLFTLFTQDHTGTYGDGHCSLNQLWQYLARVKALPASGSAPPMVAPGVLRLPRALEVHTSAAPHSNRLPADIAAEAVEASPAEVSS